MAKPKAQRSERRSLKARVFSCLPLWLIDGLLEKRSRRPGLGVERLARLDPDFLDDISRRKALRAFELAWRRTPAYREFLTGKGLDPLTVRSFSDFRDRVPSMTKENYIRVFPLAARCLGGVLPSSGTLDESAGTMDTATNWVRAPGEERGRAAITDAALYYLFGLERGGNWVLINGYLPGAWAGSQRFAASLAPFGVLKNTGPDPDKIIRTIRDLGPGPRYLVGGYPPFLMELVDYGASVPGFDWTNYRLDILTGGEGFAEEWRDHLAGRLGPGARIFSNYGAVDTDTSLSMENPLTVGIKRLAWRDAALRAALFSTDRLPCFLGQYSPLSFWLSGTARNCGRQEFDVTVLSRETASPRIRYDVGDEGGVIAFARMRKVLKERGYALSEIGRRPDGLPLVPFPFLYIFGRSDGTVFCDGATFSPSEIQAALLTEPDLSAAVCSFKMSVVEEGGRAARLAIDLELKPDVDSPKSGPEELEGRARAALVSGLLRTNPCFERSYARDPKGAMPRVRIFARRTGPFQGTPDGIKFRYLDRP